MIDYDNQFDNVSVLSQNTTIEQRLIAAKKDPDQEALEHGLLLSQQESEYGVNMYESLTPEDEPVIDDYLSQGFTREEAILIIFEEKYGKVTNQNPHITPAMPTLFKVPSNPSNPTGPSLPEPDLSEEDEAAILVLMARGYTREQAVSVHLSKKSQPRNPTSNMNLQRASQNYNYEPEGSVASRNYSYPNAYPGMRSSNNSISPMNNTVLKS